jgi:hypothetical protein
VSVQQRVQRLEALLDRIRQRAGSRQAASPAAPQPSPPLAFATPIAVPPPPAPPPPPASQGVFTVSPVLPSPLEFVDQAPLEVLGEEDVIDEIPSDMLESVPPSGGVMRADEDEPPASSQRPKALTLDEPSDGLLDDELDVPLKTPPPESGPQEAPMPAGLAAPLPPDVDLLTSDLMPLGESASDLDAPFDAAPPPPPRPTVEQLGQTIDLEEPAGPSLELAAAAPTPAPPAHPATEDLEMALPGREASGQYDAELLPPPEARDELEAHRERSGEDLVPQDSSFAESGPVLIPELFPAPVADEITATIAVNPQGQGPEVFGRPPLESGTVFRIEPTALARPSTFLELLDASIALGE